MVEELLSPVIYEQVERPDPQLVAALATCGVATVLEVMGHQLGSQQMMNPTMCRRTGKGTKAGPAVTARPGLGDNLMMHVALSLCQPGDILVVAANGGLGAQWGEMATTYAIAHRVAGVVVDGPVRDCDAVDSVGFAVWSTLVSPVAPTKVHPGWVNVPVQCAGVSVQPGDIIVADGDGVIAVPRSVANAVLDRALVRSHKEQQFRAEIVAGARLAALVGVDDQLDRLEIKRIKGRWEPKQQP